MKRCPGPGCAAQIPDTVELCALCKQRRVGGLDVPQFAAEGIAALEASLAKHVAFDDWLVAHHRL